MILYLDNIRGFSNQYVELKQVNFFVGENSTGKSSLISIISLLSDFAYNMPTEFQNQYVDFGPFSEIINRSDTSNAVFTIGIKKQNNNLGNIPFSEIILKYKEVDGFPSLSEVSMRNRNYVLSLKINSENISWKFSQPKPNISWIENHFSSENLQQIGTLTKEQFKIGFQRSPLALIFLVSSSLDKKYQFLNNVGLNFFGGFIDNSIWIDPIRSKPQRIYEPKQITYSAEGSHIPTFLRDIFLTKTEEESKKIILGLKSFGKYSGLFDDIKIDQYRKSKDSPFSLVFKLKNKNLKISNIGYGVSQIIPILTEILREQKPKIFLIQQPEVHLHPRSQAYFGEFIFDQFINNDKQFVIETHSDYVIDRFRLQLKKYPKSDLHKKVNILFFESNGIKNFITSVGLEADGNYSSNQPQNFRDFFFKEEMSLLGF